MEGGWIIVAEKAATSFSYVGKKVSTEKKGGADGPARSSLRVRPVIRRRDMKSTGGGM